MPEKTPLLIIGAGPAGLAAAHEAGRQGIRPVVLEAGALVGGIARTESHRGYRFDIGGHRFYTKVEEIRRLWADMMGPEFIKVSRLSRIYYRGRFYAYPLQLADTLRNLGLLESARIGLSYLRAKLTPHGEDKTFEDWVTHRFGDRLYRTFFKTYTEKVWGIPCDRIQAEWAAQRIHGLSLRTAVQNALFGRSGTKSLISEFDYPRLGPGQMWQRFQDRVEQAGGEVQTGVGVHTLERDGARIVRVHGSTATGEQAWEPEQVISSMPLDRLVESMRTTAPEAVRQAARQLNYRAFLIVCLVLDRETLFPDNWIYVHSPDVRVGRIQNFKNWSLAMVPETGRTCLGMEYFCTEGDDLWNRTDAELIALAGQELDALGLGSSREVCDGTVVRQTKAYPVYDQEYRGHLEVIRRYLGGIENLQTIGRNGMHRYNNQDHSMLTGLLAVRNLKGGGHDLWTVNTEQSHCESSLPRQSGSKPTA